MTRLLIVHQVRFKWSPPYMWWTYGCDFARVYRAIRFGGNQPDGAD
jgi:hypothetical protein